MLVGKEHNFILEMISKLNLKLVVFLTVVFSMLINIGHAFQYRINSGQGEIDSGYLTHDLYPSIVSLNTAFKWYSIVYFFINFALFLAINTCVEVSLLLKLRSEIADKRTKAEAEILISQSKNVSGSEVINRIIKAKKKKIEQDAKKDTRAVVMVITNSCLNFILRLPEIFVFLSANHDFFYDLFNFVTMNIYFALYTPLSSILVSLSYLFYIFTFTANVGIYYLFNPVFKQHFIWWESNAKRK
jgi:hypothetical protein